MTGGIWGHGTTTGRIRARGVGSAPPDLVALDVTPCLATWAAVAVPVLVGLLVADSGGRQLSVGESAAVACQITMLSAAVGFAAHRHRSGSTLSGWLSAALTLPPVAVSLTSIAAVLDERTASVAGATTLYLLGGAVALAWAVAGLRGATPPRDSVGVGFVGGALVCVAAVAVSLTRPVSVLPRPLDLAPAVLLAAVVVALALRAGWGLAHRDDLHRWILRPLLLGSAALALGAAASTWLRASFAAEVAETAFLVLAWGCFLTVTLELLALMTQGHLARPAPVGPPVARVDDLRRAQATLHEVRATVAGLASASRLMSADDTLPGEVRQRLQMMSAAEIARMERLLADREPGRQNLVEAVEPVVEALRSRGHDVRVQADGDVLNEAADDVVRIVHVLLENAARHGDGAIELALDTGPDDVVISVTDTGPGVPEAIRPRIFDWGVSGAASSGIGLHDASTRARAIGGELHLSPRTADRTRFELVLPLGAGAVR